MKLKNKEIELHGCDNMCRRVGLTSINWSSAVSCFGRHPLLFRCVLVVFSSVQADVRTTHQFVCGWVFASVCLCVCLCVCLSVYRSDAFEHRDNKFIAEMVEAK